MVDMHPSLLATIALLLVAGMLYSFEKTRLFSFIPNIIGVFFSGLTGVHMFSEGLHDTMARLFFFSPVLVIAGAEFLFAFLFKKAKKTFTQKPCTE